MNQPLTLAQSILITALVILWVFVAVGVIIFIPSTQAITPALWIHLTAVLLLLLLIKRLGGSILDTLKIQKIHYRWWISATLLAVIYWFIDHWIMQQAFKIDSTALIYAWNQANSGYLAWSVFIGTVFMAPLFEELFFRGLIFNAILQRYNMLAATSISSLLFALVHWSWPEFTSLIIAGLLYAFLAYKSKSVITPIIAHLTHNLFTYIYYLNNFVDFPNQQMLAQ